jgi:hypothetical protein
MKTVTQPAPVFVWDKLRTQSLGVTWWISHLYEVPVEGLPCWSDRTRPLSSHQLITVWELTMSWWPSQPSLDGWSRASSDSPSCHRAFTSVDVHIVTELVDPLRRFCDIDFFSTSLPWVCFDLSERNYSLRNSSVW